MRSSLCLVITAAGCLGGCAASQARSAAPAPVVVVGETAKTEKGREGAITPKDSPDPHLARQAALEEASKYGLLGVLGGTDPDDEAGGVVGGIVGGVPGSAFGSGGLGLSGVGVGGGGQGEGIGIGTLGTLGHGSVVGGILGGPGDAFGYGGLGLRGSSARAKPRLEEATVMGPLTREVVQRVASDHMQDVEDCYALEAQRSSPRGRIMLAFTIDGTGRVTEVRVPDAAQSMRELPSCIGQVLGTWKFPPPTGGSEVKVLLPLSI
jgi:hypothetical protein